MGKGGKETTQSQDQTSRVDPNTRRFIEDFLRPLGQRGASIAQGQPGSFFAGPTGAQQQALDRMGQDISGAGDFNFSPEQMDPNRAQAFFNPFEDQVVGAAQQNFDRQRQQALNQAAQEATGAGAFGGSRSGILQAQALGDVNRNESQTLAQLRNQGFQNAQQMAAQEHGLMQNLGFGSAQAAQQGRLRGAGLGLQQAGQQFQMGERQRQIQQQRLQEPLFRQRQALQMANSGFGMPTGQTTRGTTTTEESGGGLFGNLLGAGMTAVGAGLNPFGLFGSDGGSGGGSGGSGSRNISPGLMQAGQQFMGGNLGFGNMPVLR